MDRLEGELTEEQLAGMAEHGWWIATNPIAACSLLAAGVRLIGGTNAKSAVTRAAVEEVAALCFQLGLAFDAVGRVIYDEVEHGRDMEAEFADWKRKMPNPHRNYN